MVYAQIIDEISQKRKHSMTGQMSLFDMVGEEEKKGFEVQLPDVGEYTKEILLAFEKEVLGVYISGHPLQAHEEMWRKNISALTSDFVLDEETNQISLEDGSRQIIGGMITSKTIKYTKNNKAMAFITVEDLVGTVEVVIFPRDYEANASFLNEDEKVFVKGRVSAEEDKPGKLICEKIVPFGEVPKEIWIQFPDKESFLGSEKSLYEIIGDSDGRDGIVIYVASPKSIKRLPKSQGVNAEKTLVESLSRYFGEKNVKVVEKSIEKMNKMN